MGLEPCQKNGPLHGVGVLKFIDQNLAIPAIKTAEQGGPQLRVDEAQCGLLQSIVGGFVVLAGPLIRLLNPDQGRSAERSVNR